MFGDPTFVKDYSQVFHIVGMYMIKDLNAQKKARMVGGHHSNLYLDSSSKITKSVSCMLLTSKNVLTRAIARLFVKWQIYTHLGSHRNSRQISLHPNNSLDAP
jgi:hypothetical protein